MRRESLIAGVRSQAIAAIAVFVSATASGWWMFPEPPVGGIWLGAGVGAGLAIVLGPGVWLGLLAGVLAAHFTVGFPLSVPGYFASSALMTLGWVLAAYLVHRRTALHLPDFSLRDLGLATAILLPVHWVAADLTTAVLQRAEGLTAGIGLAEQIVLYVAGSTQGIILGLPLVLEFSRDRFDLRATRIVELSAIALFTGTATAIVHFDIVSHELSRLLVIVPFLGPALAAVRLGVKEALATYTLMTVVTLAGTTRGFGPLFVGAFDERTLLVGSVISFGGLATYALASLQRDRQNLLTASRVALASKTYEAATLEAALNLASKMDSKSAPEIMQTALDKAEQLTGSAVGFFHLVDADEEDLELVAWSTAVKARCFVPEDQDRHYPVSRAGVWVDCIRERDVVIHNDYASLPHRKGYPQGHVQIIREVVCPIFDSDRIVAVIGVGNKETDYDKRDADTLTLLAKNAWTLIRLRAAKDELQRFNIELAEATEAKSRFIANMSHELRTPLNSIIGFSGVLLSGMAGELGDEQRRQLNMISESGHHLLDLINDVLDIAKIEADRLEVESERFVPGRLLEEAVEAVRPLADEKRLALSFVCECPPGEFVTGGERQISQIVLNLLGNAVKFTEEGSVSAACRLDGNELVIKVKDTGVGINAQGLAVIFDEYRQLEARGVGKPAGTGLGLALSRKLARMLGGDVHAESVLGRGSEFTLVTPVERVASD